MKLSNVFYILGFASILASAANFVSGNTKNTSKEESEKERDALFVGFWPPTFFILGKIIEDRENAGKNIITG
ncbi:hypothetical protein DAETH_08600 [Deinococcus aetherius]|uniref:Uncharacterized protein n=1 Tax=Deinococcus aetherius TaxID=200252 RepID=A0ABN6RC61_9DEIO|nr:hypothetical protein [Deinococcus aetherius]BDP40891.1 hypothetical protein DAETH_08600 [Deinococcus aetherius]